MSERRVPVTVIGGYLGAGKTTLINQLLAGRHGRRLAILVNDFGSVNIDAGLIASHDGETISLENGCICCSLADSLGDALDAVLALDPAPDQIVIEASGVADPAKVAHYGQGWPGCRLDAVVVLADAETIRRLSDDQFVGELVIRQLRSGDVVVLTKTDLVPDSSLDELEAWINTMDETSGTVVRVAHGLVDHRVVLDSASDVASFGSTGESVDVHELFESVVFEFSSAVEREWLESALESWSDQIVRVKGIIALVDEGRHLVHRVAKRWSIEPTSDNCHANSLVVVALSGAAELSQIAADVKRVNLLKD